MSGKLVVGIDLGTTHCALALAPLSTPNARVEVLPIEQLVAPGSAEKRALLPSFLYFAHGSEAANCPQVVRRGRRRTLSWPCEASIRSLARRAIRIDPEQGGL